MTKICNKCGTHLEENINFCTNCGNAMNETNNVLSNVSKYLIKDNIKDLKDFLGGGGLRDLEKTLKRIEEESGPEQATAYFEYTLNRIKYITDRKDEYKIESKLADKVYKSYVTDGISRLEKVNGRFMASQTVKLDMLIEQNTKIIQLLQEINKKLDK